MPPVEPKKKNHVIYAPIDAPEELVEGCESLGDYNSYDVVLLPCREFATATQESVFGLNYNNRGRSRIIISYFDSEVAPAGFLPPHFHKSNPTIECWCPQPSEFTIKFAVDDIYRRQLKNFNGLSMYSFTFNHSKADTMVRLLAVKAMGDMLSDSFLIGIKSIKITPKHISELARYKKWTEESASMVVQIRAHERNIHTWTTSIKGAFKSIHDLQSLPKEFVFNTNIGVEKVFSHPKIQSCNTEANLKSLTVITKIETVPLLYEFNKPGFTVALPIGRFTVEIEKGDANINWTDAPSIGGCHPHIMDGGAICWGGFGDAIIKHLSTGSTEFGADEIIQYLEMVDYNSKYRSWQQALNSLGLHINESDWMAGVPLKPPSGTPVIVEDEEEPEIDTSDMLITPAELTTLRSQPTTTQEDAWLATGTLTPPSITLRDSR